MWRENTIAPRDGRFPEGAVFRVVIGGKPHLLAHGQRQTNKDGSLDEALVLPRLLGRTYPDLPWALNPQLDRQASQRRSTLATPSDPPEAQPLVSGLIGPGLISPRPFRDGASPPRVQLRIGSARTPRLLTILGA